jgi:excisionase family DNA binding protein
MPKKSAVSDDTDAVRSKAAPLAPLDVNQRYDINEAAEYLRISRARLYQKIAAGEIRRIKDGRRSFVPGSDIKAAST